MADWIKVETTSSQKIEVLTMADILDMDEHMVFGKLVIVWCWADANTVDGNARNVTKRMIDRVACNAGFADAMLHESVGWLKEDENGNISFSNFDRHNGKGAKKRATTARRVQEHRSNVTESVTISSQKCNGESVTKAIPEKIREEKNNKELSNAIAKDRIDYNKVMEIFNSKLTKAANIIKMNDKRKRLIKKLFKEYDFNIDRWEAYVCFINSSPECSWMFETQDRGNGQVWQPKGFDYIATEACYLKVKETY